MATQHPDSTRRFSSRDELREAIQVVKQLPEGGFGCDEIMVDYEGKLTPYHLPSWIVSEALKEGLEPGSDFLITVRIPSEHSEGVERHLMTLMAVTLANYRSYREAGYEAIKYVVIPMSEKPKDIMEVQRRLNRLIRFVEDEADLRVRDGIHVVPLFESVRKHLNIDYLMDAVITGLTREVGHYIEEVRVFLGKSDAAITSGHVASVLSIKVALAKLRVWSAERGFSVYPIVGVGKPPMRGHLREGNELNWVNEYAGFATVTVQSALRYNTQPRHYVRVREALLSRVGSTPSLEPLERYQEVLKIVDTAERFYVNELKRVSEVVWSLSKYVPRTRERTAHEEYHRISHGVRVPRAITFVAAMYTAGFPPSLLGLGRVVKALSAGRADGLETLLKLYPSLVPDIRFSLKYLVRDTVLRYFGRQGDYLLRGVKEITDVLAVDFEGHNPEYLKLATTSVPTPELVVKLAELRGFLG